MDDQTMAMRSQALETARDFVAPILESCPPEEYESVNSTGLMLVAANRTTMTKADQVIGHILEVANWLLNE